MIVLYLYGVYIGSAIVLGFLKYRELDKTKFIEEIEMTKYDEDRTRGLWANNYPIR